MEHLLIYWPGENAKHVVCAFYRVFRVRLCPPFELRLKKNTWASFRVSSTYHHYKTVASFCKNNQHIKTKAAILDCKIMEKNNNMFSKYSNIISFVIKTKTLKLFSFLSSAHVWHSTRYCVYVFPKVSEVSLV